MLRKLQDAVIGRPQTANRFPVYLTLPQIEIQGATLGKSSMVCNEPEAETREAAVGSRRLYQTRFACFSYLIDASDVLRPRSFRADNYSPYR